MKVFFWIRNSNKPQNDCCCLVLVDGRELVVQVVGELRMDFVPYHDNLMSVNSSMDVADRDDDDSEHTGLFQLLLDKILNYYNHLVVFDDSNLNKKKKRFILEISFSN